MSFVDTMSYYIVTLFWRVHHRHMMCVILRVSIVHCLVILSLELLALVGTKLGTVLEDYDAVRCRDLYIDDHNHLPRIRSDAVSL